MCCADDGALYLPAAVIEMLARYRRMRDEQGFGWGEEALPDFFRWARFSRLGPAFDEFAASGDWSQAVRAAVGDDVPAGLVLVSITAGGGLSARTGPPRPAIVGGAVQVDVVVDSAVDHDVVVTVAGEDVPVPAAGAGLCTLDRDAEAPHIVVTCGDARLEVNDAVVATPAAALQLTSRHGARWSVLDATGGAWFADGVPRKWDADDRPFFHTGPGTVIVAVPAGPLRVTAARGLEFERQEYELDPPAGETVAVDYRPARRFDPADDGWYGGDLHVHLNYSGDYVVHPAEAARMQCGEGLHLMHLAAGNLGGSLVYDRELLESTAGTERRPGDRLTVRARVTGSGVRRLVLYGPDGALASSGGDLLEHEVVLDEAGSWLAAAAHGDDDPYTVGAPVFAHTTPVYVDVDGQRVARPASARWCLGLLDRLQQLATEHGRFDPHRRDRQLGDLTAVLDRARQVYRAVER